MFAYAIMIGLISLSLLDQLIFQLTQGKTVWHSKVVNDDNDGSENVIQEGSRRYSQSFIH